MLTISNLTKQFGGVMALDHCSLTVPPGQITALIGPNGAGKTTLLDLISGLLQPDGGQIVSAESPLKIKGAEQGARTINLVGYRADQRANLGLSRTFQQVRLFRHLTILDHLLMAEDNEDTKLWRNVLGPRKIDSQGRAERVDYIKSFGIDKSLNTTVSELSYGQRKLLQLAVALKKHHHLLLLDEPVAGVNAVLQKKIEDLIFRLKAQGETILIVEHDMDFVRRLSDHVIVLDEGKVLLAGRPDEVLSDRRVLAAYLGE